MNRRAFFLGLFAAAVPLPTAKRSLHFSMYKRYVLAKPLEYAESRVAGDLLYYWQFDSPAMSSGTLTVIPYGPLREIAMKELHRRG